MVGELTRGVWFEAYRRLVFALSLLLVMAAPAAVAEAGQDGRALSWKPHVREARAFAKRRSGEVSFTVVAGSRRYQLAGQRMAPMASTVKVMLMTSYLRRRSVARRKLRRGERRLIRAMIRRSDDASASEISIRIGPGALPHLARAVGIRDFRNSTIWGMCESSPRSQAGFMRRLPDLLPARHRAFALRQLRWISPPQRWGIGRERPPGWKLYFKGGWGSGSGAVDHQIALLRRGRARIGVAIQTRYNPSHEYAKATLRGVAARLLRGLPR